MQLRTVNIQFLASNLLDFLDQLLAGNLYRSKQAQVDDLESELPEVREHASKLQQMAMDLQRHEALSSELPAKREAIQVTSQAVADMQEQVHSSHSHASHMPVTTSKPACGCESVLVLERTCLSKQLTHASRKSRGPCHCSVMEQSSRALAAVWCAMHLTYNCRACRWPAKRRAWRRCRRSGMQCSS
jgi:hypothetical protein